VRCLVIEDEADIADYICNGLRQVGYNVTLAQDGINGLHLATEEAWDILILDRMLPDGLDGLDILKSLREAGKGIPVLIVSAFAGLDERVRGLNSGCDDYMTKPFAFTELLARVQALLRRPALREEASVLTIADLKLDLKSRKVWRAGQQIALQPREFRLLEALVRSKGEVVTRTMLLESVWDYHFDPQTGVIDVQISRLRQKIDKGFASPLIHTVRGAGYRVSVDG